MSLENVADVEVFDKYEMHDVNGVVWQMQSRSQITEAIKNVNFQVAEPKLKSSLFDIFLPRAAAAPAAFRLAAPTLFLMKVLKLDHDGPEQSRNESVIYYPLRVKLDADCLLYFRKVSLFTNRFEFFFPALAEILYGFIERCPRLLFTMPCFL